MVVPDWYWFLLIFAFGCWQKRQVDYTCKDMETTLF